MNILDRLREHIGDIELSMDSSIELTYRWNKGYEFLQLKWENDALLEYHGHYHPNEVCEGNPCQYCGYTAYEE